MDNLGQIVATKLITELTQTISLFPGGFKPPHKGHFDIVENAAKNSDEVHVIIANNVREGYTPELSLKIWEQYKKLLPENVKIYISKDPSPITEVYSIIKNKTNNYLVIYGKGEQDRYNYINENREKYSNVEVVDAGQIGEISATKLREAISKRNKLAIKALLPEGIKVDDFLMNFQIHEIKVNSPLIPSDQEIVDITIRKSMNDLPDILHQFDFKFREETFSMFINRLSINEKLKYYKQLIKLPDIIYEIKINKPSQPGKIINTVGDEFDINIYKSGIKYEDNKEKIDASLDSRGYDYGFNRKDDTYSLVSYKDNPTNTFYHFDDEIEILKNIREIKVNNPIRLKFPLKVTRESYKELAPKLEQLGYKWRYGDQDLPTQVNPFPESGNYQLSSTEDKFLSWGEIFREGRDYHQLLVNMAKRKDPDRLTSLGKTYLPKEEIPGGLAKGKSLIDIAKHHRVPQANIYKQLQKGIKVEMEHTTSKEVAKEIAMDHLWEDPKYYDKLDSIEEIKVNKPGLDFDGYGNWVYVINDKEDYNKITKILSSRGWKRSNEYITIDDSLRSLSPGEYIVLFSIKSMDGKIYVLSSTTDKNLNGFHILNPQTFKLKTQIQEIKINKPFPSFPITLTNTIDAKQTAFKLYQLGYKATNWTDEENYYYYFPFQQTEDGEEFEPIILTTNGKELEWNTVRHIDYDDNEEIIFEIGKNAIKEVLGEIKINKPGLNFPIKIETPEQAQKIGKILKDRGYLFKDYIDREDPEINSFNEFEPFFQFNFYPFIITQYDGNILDYNYITELNESIQINPKQYIKLLNELVEDCCKELEIQKPVIKLINNDKYTLENKSYAGYFPGINEIKVVIYGRNLADSCRSLSHELKHAQQQSKGELTQGAGEDGDKFENEANSFSGKKMREFGRKHPEIYFMKYDKN